MMHLFRKLKLYFKPPKAGDVYYGNPINFVNKPLEKILHGLKDKSGDDLYVPIPNKECYRLIIESAEILFYRCISEVFCKSVVLDKYGYNDLGRWMKRTQSRRIGKDSFENMIIGGVLKRK